MESVFDSESARIHTKSTAPLNTNEVPLERWSSAPWFLGPVSCCNFGTSREVLRRQENRQRLARRMVSLAFVWRLILPVLKRQLRHGCQNCRPQIHASKYKTCNRIPKLKSSGCSLFNLRPRVGRGTYMRHALAPRADTERS